MLEITHEDSRYTKWKNIIESQEKSGLSQIEYCKQNDLSISQLGYYRKRIKNSKFEGQKLNSFTPIKINQTVEGTNINIIFPSGIRCNFPSNTNREQIKNLLEVLCHVNFT